MADNRKRPSLLAGIDAKTWRVLGLGLELGAATAGMAYLGYWLDGRWGTGPWLAMGGVVLGLTGGLWNVVREVWRGRI